MLNGRGGVGRAVKDAVEHAHRLRRRGLVGGAARNREQSVRGVLERLLVGRVEDGQDGGALELGRLVAEGLRGGRAAAWERAGRDRRGP